MSALEDVNTLEQAAAYLKTDEAKVTRLKGEGRLGFIKIGRVTHYTRQDLEEFVKSNRTPAARSNPHGLSDTSLARVRGRAA